MGETYQGSVIEFEINEVGVFNLEMSVVDDIGGITTEVVKIKANPGPLHIYPEPKSDIRAGVETNVKVRTFIDQSIELNDLDYTLSAQNDNFASFDVVNNEIIFNPLQEKSGEHRFTLTVENQYLSFSREFVVEVVQLESVAKVTSLNAGENIVLPLPLHSALFGATLTVPNENLSEFVDVEVFEGQSSTGEIYFDLKVSGEASMPIKIHLPEDSLLAGVTKLGQFLTDGDDFANHSLYNRYIKSINLCPQAKNTMLFEYRRVSTDFDQVTPIYFTGRSIYSKDLSLVNRLRILKTVLLEPPTVNHDFVVEPMSNLTAARVNSAAPELVYLNSLELDEVLQFWSFIYNHESHHHDQYRVLGCRAFSSSENVRSRWLTETAAQFSSFMKLGFEKTLEYFSGSPNVNVYSLLSKGLSEKDPYEDFYVWDFAPIDEFVFLKTNAVRYGSSKGPDLFMAQFTAPYFDTNHLYGTSYLAAQAGMARSVLFNGDHYNYLSSLKKLNFSPPVMNTTLSSTVNPYAINIHQIVVPDDGYYVIEGPMDDEWSRWDVFNSQKEVDDYSETLSPLFVSDGNRALKWYANSPWFNQYLVDRNSDKNPRATRDFKIYEYKAYPQYRIVDSGFYDVDFTRYTVKIDLSGTKDYKMREVTNFRGLEGNILTRYFRADCNQERLEFASATAVDEVFGDVYIFSIPVLIPAADCSYWGI